MKVALDVSPLFHTTKSGIATYLLELMEHLPRVVQGDQFVWWYCAPWRSTGRGLPPELRGLAGVRKPSLPPRVLQYAWKRLELPSVRTLMGDPDIYHASHIWEPPLGRAAAIVTIHDLTPLVAPQWHTPGIVDVYRKFLAFTASRAAGVIVDSIATRHDLLALHPELEARTRVIYLSASERFGPVDDVSEVKAKLRDMGLVPSSYILYAGALEPRKNLDRLLHAYRELGNHRDAVPDLVLAGPAGWGDMSVSDLAGSLGIADRVKITGAVSAENLRYLMAGALVFVYPSLYEGFGLPPLEAMACGTPVITSNNSSLPEVVGDAAILVDPERIDDLSNALNRVLTDAKLRTDMGVRGLERAGAFSWQATAQQTRDFYSDVLAGRPKGTKSV